MRNENHVGSSIRLVGHLSVAVLTWVMLVEPMAAGFSPTRGFRAGGTCQRTAQAASQACTHESRDDYWIAVGNCLNERRGGACMAEATAGLREALAECRGQSDARLDLCEDLGRDRYDPEFDPEDFETEFDNLNPYFPLEAGNSWVYVGGSETITVEVLEETKLIEDVTCIVVKDLVEDEGDPIEDTDDWYAQASNGDVYYCGEVARNLEAFDGDETEEPELVNIDGSWKAGRDDAKVGVLMFRFPEVGRVYRQEMALGEAEDVAEVLSISYGFGDDPDLDQLVPEDLAELLCSEDCVVTRDFSPLEPGHEERKYYAPGIGLFLEVNLEDEEITQLVDCNVDEVCSELSMPE